MSTDGVSSILQEHYDFEREFRYRCTNRQYGKNDTLMQQIKVEEKDLVTVGQIFCNKMSVAIC